MMPAPVRAAVIALVFAVVSTSARAQERGGIAGRVSRQDDTPVPGVMVLVRETGATAWTAVDGRYRFTSLEPGEYTLVLVLGNYSATERAALKAGQITSLSTVVDWPLSYVEAVVVTSASRQLESLAEAPAAITKLDAADVARQSGSGQLPVLLASAPGVQVAQSGLYDFNVNARGFNDLVNRRVRTEIDGREASLPQVMGYTDWATLPFGLGEVEQIELLRGPGGALYGVGALNGVISVQTKAPSDSLGGRARFTFGDLDTVRVDARQAVSLGDGWFFKAVGGYQRSRDFARSRVAGVEYAPGVLPTEAVPLVSDHASLSFGTVRLDRLLAGGTSFLVEAGTATKDGQVTATNLGRYQATDSAFPWMRAAFRSTDWSLLGAWTSADIDNQVALSAGNGTYQAAYNLQIDGQTNRTLPGGRGRWVAGGSYSRQRVDSADPQGVQTNYEHPETADGGAAFGQIDYKPASRLKTSFAGRVDWSSLSRTTFSPRAAAIYEVGRGQRARFAFSNAYKAPTIAEQRLRAPLAPPLDLSAIERALGPLLGGTPLGFSSVPLLAVGNEALDVEEITSVEAGYTVALGGRTFLQATWYRNHVDTFTSGLLPQVGTSLGRLNPAFGPYQPPSTLSPAAASAVTGALAQALPPNLYASMTNLSGGAPAFAVLSLANFGQADTQGVEVGVTSHLKHGWRLDASYAWFDFSVENDAPDVPLLPNTPRHQGAIGVAQASRLFDVAVRARLVDGFEWVSGIYAGPVPAYGVVDAQANWRMTSRFSVGLDVTNLLDHAHYEMFGGDLLGRRALGHVTTSW